MKMRNRRSIIALFLILAIMLVGVGYAAIEGKLTIEGSAGNTPQKFNVVFTGVTLQQLVDSENDNVVPAASAQNTKLIVGQKLDIANLFTASFTVTGLATMDDEVIYVFDIKNNNKVDMQLTPSITGNSKFAVEGGFPDTNSDGTLESTVVIPAEGTTTYTVVVKLADEYDASYTESILITLNGLSTTVAP